MLSFYVAFRFFCYIPTPTRVVNSRGWNRNCFSFRIQTEIECPQIEISQKTIGRFYALLLSGIAYKTPVDMIRRGLCNLLSFLFTPLLLMSNLLKMP